MTNLPKGEATVTFDDPDTAKAAIDWFDGLYHRISILAYMFDFFKILF